MVMAAATPTVRWNRTMLEALPADGQRHEIIDGVHHVTPSPTPPHQVVVGELQYALRSYLECESVGWVISSPSDVDLGNDTIVQPDLIVFPHTGRGTPRSWAEAGLPTVAIEVVSPSSSSRDRIVKRRRYQRAAIAEYWIVDPAARLVERWRPSDERPEIITDTLVWQPAGAEQALLIPLQPIFEAVADAS